MEHFGCIVAAVAAVLVAVLLAVSYVKVPPDMAHVERVPESMTDGSPFGYERGVLACLPEERCPDELAEYRRVDAAGRVVSVFPGFRVSFKYAHPEEDGPFHFSVPVLMR